MPLVTYTGPNPDKETLGLIKNQLLNLWYYLRQYHDLYDSERSVNLLNETAPDFFGAIQTLIRDHLVLEITILAEHRYKDVSSIVNFHRKNKEALGEESAKRVDALVERLASLVAPMRTYRSKFVAHKNEEALLNTPEDGGFSLGEVEEAWSIVQQCVEIYDLSFSSYRIDTINDLTRSARSLLNYLEDSRLRDP